MVFSRLFRPKWQHKDPEVRIQAINDLGPRDLEVLTEIAWNDPSPNLRRLAIRKIDRLDLLMQLAERNSDNGTRDYAQLQLRSVVAGERGDAGFEQRLAVAKRRPQDGALMEYLAEKGREVELRELALDHCHDPQVLGNVALGDGVAAIRRKAVERLQEPSVLERVFREARKRDKQVSRIAKERLDTHHASQERPRQLRAQAESVVERLAQLGKQATWEHDKATLDHLEQQWQESLEVVDLALAERYRELHARFLDAYQGHLAARQAQAEAESHYSPIREARDAALSALTQLESQLRPLQATTPEQGQAFDHQFEHAQTLWRNTGELPAAEERDYQQRYRTLAQAVRQLLDARQEAGRNRHQAEHLVEEAQTLLAQERPIGRGRLEKLRGQWRKLDLPKGHETLAQAFANAEAELSARIELQGGQMEQRLAELPTLLDALAAAIEEGAASQATPLHDKVQSRLRDLTEMETPKGRLLPLEERFRELSAEVRQLRDWRKWAADRERERLIAEMDGLASSDLPAEALAEQVKALQVQWKALEAGGNAADKRLWNRFQEAGHRAYIPVKAHEAQLAEQRRQNAVLRGEFLDRLEAQLEAIDWKAIDWKQAVRAERDLLNQWHGLGPVERKARRQLDQRFDGYLASYRDRLDGERKRNRRLREGLIEQVEKLMELEDVQAAIERVRELQSQWVTTVTGRRKEENELWQRFKEAVDGVYGRRREQRNAEQRELEENLARKQALAEEAKGLLGCDYAGLRQAEQEMGRLRDAYNEVGPVPKGSGREANQTLRDAEQALSERADALRGAFAREQFGHLAAHAALAASLEQRLLGGEALSLDALADARAALPALSGEANQAAAEARFRRLAAAIEGQGYSTEELAQVRALREQLCLRMEILAGVDSPAEAAQARMAYQVDRLSQAMAQGQLDSTEECEAVQREWYTTSPLTPTDASLAERFAKALTALVPPNV